MMNGKVKIIRPDYKAIREMSKRMDCTITDADFNTEEPNPDRLDCVSADINKYLKYKNGGRLNGFKHRGTRALHKCNTR